MNPGANNLVPRFSRKAVSFMSEQEKDDWNSLDSLNASGNRLVYGRRARRARMRVPQTPADQVQYTPSDRIARRAASKRARLESKRLLGRARRAVRGGDRHRIAVAVENYLRSYAAKLCAYTDAWREMKPDDRPHFAVLSDYAARLEPYKLEFEEASVWFKRKSDRLDGMRDMADYRQLVNFGIHHRARQRLVLSLLKVCFGELREDQYQQQGLGRDAAVAAVINQMRFSQNQFFAECDVENFFPTIGEKYGRLSPTNILHEQLYMLPKAIVESSVLSSGVIYHTPGGAALSRNTPIRTGVPQGSALSSFLSEYIIGQIMSEAETLALCGQVMIAYCDNIAIFGQSREDVNSMTEPLVRAAERSPYGEFRLRRTQSTRHISQGFQFLGYYFKWHQEGWAGYVEVDVMDKNKEKFQAKIAEIIPRCRFSRGIPRAERNAALEELDVYITGWVRSFQRADDIGGIAAELLDEALSGESTATRLAFNPLLEMLS